MPICSKTTSGRSCRPRSPRSDSNFEQGSPPPKRVDAHRNRGPTVFQSSPPAGTRESSAHVDPQPVAACCASWPLGCRSSCRLFKRPMARRALNQGLRLDGTHKGGVVQYLGTVASISSDQAPIPPLTLFRYLKPCSRRKRRAFIDRTPLLQWM